MKKIVAIPLVLVALAAAVVLYRFDPTRVPIYPVCQFHRLTGLDCPGCGATRALHELLHGHLDAALHYNAFLVLSLPLWAGFGLQFAWRKFRQQPVAAPRPGWLVFYLAAFVVFGILRDLPVPFLAAFGP